ncbi:MAG: class II glutamine amidotransferase [Candidatus Bathyarchaeia archaeon]
MLGLLSADPIDHNWLLDFRKLAVTGRVKSGSKEGHRSGWGISYYEHGEAKYLARQSKDASDDPNYPVACTKLQEMNYDGILIAHLRKASMGNISVENTHPFIHGQWSFGHNGTVKGAIPTNNDYHPAGTTDSERFFAYLVSWIKTNGDTTKAIIEGLSVVRRECKYTSLSFLLSDGQRLYAYREFAKRNEKEYYGMMYTQEAKKIVFSQEPLWNFDWTEVNNRQLIVADMDLAIQKYQI